MRWEDGIESGMRNLVAYVGNKDTKYRHAFDGCSLVILVIALGRFCL